MKQKRFTEEQKAFALRQADSGVPVPEILRKLGISEATFYRWKKKPGCESGRALVISTDD